MSPLAACGMPVLVRMRRLGCADALLPSAICPVLAAGRILG